jgi:dolichol-phosphate mannosyltransferase
VHELPKSATLSVVIPCYNEASTLTECLSRLLAIQDHELSLEVVIVDDGSTDDSWEVAQRLSHRSSNVRTVRHPRNLGKGAALRTGFRMVTGDFVAVQDADLEYDPRDLRRLVEPLREGIADVVFGSRFRSSSVSRVLFFWHYAGNRILTLLSNMFTDLNLTDMETGYKVFRRELIQELELREDRFGFEPEVVAKLARKRPRIYETGISYRGRTYEEGKKIGWKDGVRAVYCIFRYGAHHAAWPMQLITYLVIGSLSAVVNLILFALALRVGSSILVAAPTAFVLAAAFNYLACVLLLFRHKARWGSVTEVFIYLVVVAAVGVADLVITEGLVAAGLQPLIAKGAAAAACFMFNFLGRKFFVFPEPSAGAWRPSIG